MRTHLGGWTRGVRVGAGLALAVPAIAISVILGTSGAQATTPSPEPVSTAVAVDESPGTSESPTPGASVEPSSEPSGQPWPEIPTEGTGTIRGKVWDDRNKNGIQDANEPGVPNVTIGAFGFFDENSEPLLREGVTDANGEYEFTNLPAGVWGIAAPLFSPWKLTTPEAPGADCRKNSDLFDTEKVEYPTTVVCDDYETIDLSAPEASPLRRQARAAMDNYPDSVGSSRILILRDKKVINIDAGIYGGTVPSSSPSAPVVPSASPSDDPAELPVTGTAIGGVAGAGALLLAGGAALMFAARRRRNSENAAQ